MQFVVIMKYELDKLYIYILYNKRQNYHTNMNIEYKAYYESIVFIFISTNTHALENCLQ